jgi:hypothetical protein
MKIQLRPHFTDSDVLITVSSGIASLTAFNGTNPRLRFRTSFSSEFLEGHRGGNVSVAKWIHALFLLSSTTRRLMGSTSQCASLPFHGVSARTICAMLTESEMAQRTRGERLLISLDSTRASFTAAIRPAMMATVLG